MEEKETRLLNKMEVCNERNFTYNSIPYKTTVLYILL